MGMMQRCMCYDIDRREAIKKMGMRKTAHRLKDGNQHDENGHNTAADGLSAVAETWDPDDGWVASHDEVTCGTVVSEFVWSGIRARGPVGQPTVTTVFKTYARQDEKQTLTSQSSTK